MFRTLSSIIGLAVVALAAAPALAQKSKDTLRFPLPEALSNLDRYLNPGSFANVWEPSIHDNLLGYDPTKGQFTPLLAKSWSQPTPTTFEFELRNDVKWHDGQPLDADDVVYTLNWVIDPKVAMRYKKQWEWIRSVEKLGSHKIRITAKSPVPDALTWMSFGTPIYPEHIHAPLADKNEFGVKPIGTGPYKVVKIDKNAGIFAEKYAGFVPGPTKPSAPIGRVIAEPIPDSGTMVAALLADKIDVAIDIPVDQALELRDSGRFEVTLSPPPLGYTYLQFPTAAWAESKPLADPRVRKAIVMAIDRNTLIKSQFGALAAGLDPMEGLCSKAGLRLYQAGARL
jgi:peptide/nickel transport system substrate-binding protein